MASSPERNFAAAVSAGLAIPVAYVGLRGLGLPWSLAGTLAAILGAAGAIALGRRLPDAFDGARRRRPWLCGAWVGLALFALAMTVRLSAFMLDSGRPQQSVLPHDPWYVRHCCLTAYTEGARLVREGEPNPYKAEHYRDRFLGPFQVDLYHYPPPFLLYPTAVGVAVGNDFLDTRRVWFGLSGLGFLAALLFVALRLDPVDRVRAFTLVPVVWISLPLLLGLQMGNFQILVLAIAGLALAVFPRYPALGGALLALAAVGKVFPVILLVYLLVARKWREAAWTIGFSAVLVLLALFLLGATPFRAFLEYELPRLSSGEAFARPFSRAFSVAVNMSPFGLALKLKWLGVPGMSLMVGRVLGTLYALAVLVLVVRLGRRPQRTRTEETAVWLAMLSLGTLASPFAPASYVLLSLVWLLSVHRSVIARPASFVAAWVAISAPLLLPREGPHASAFLPLLVAQLPAQALALAVPAMILYRAGSRGRG